MKKTDVKESLLIITQMLAGIHQKMEELDQRIASLEGHDEEDEDVCECGANHQKELAEMIGHVVNIELKDSKAGPWFLVMTVGPASLLVQELTKPSAPEKIGDPRWYTLNEINRITMEKSL